MTEFVAEFTTNHMGNLNVLLRMVEKAKEAGADYIKMQKKDVESYYSKEKLDAPFDSPYGKTYRDYRTIFEFGFFDFVQFEMKCKEVGIEWFSTVQDTKSLSFLKAFNPPKYKIASSSCRDIPFLNYIASNVPTDKEIVISVGGSTLEEVDMALKAFPNHKIHLLHCVAEYPTPQENLRLGNIDALKKTFGSDRISVGFSSHAKGYSCDIIAYKKYNLSLLEKHFCLSRHSFVHHIDCSLEPEEFKLMVDFCKNPEIAVDFNTHPKQMFESSFGMSDIEKEFLLKQTYGNTYLGNKSEL